MQYVVYRSLAGRNRFQKWKVVKANTPEIAAKAAGVSGFTHTERHPTRHNYTSCGWSYTIRRAVQAEKE